MTRWLSRWLTSPPSAFLQANLMMVLAEVYKALGRCCWRGKGRQEACHHPEHADALPPGKSGGCGWHRAVVFGVHHICLDHSCCTVQVTIPQADPLFQQKRSLLQRHNLATQQTFQLQRNKVALSCQ